SGTLQLQGNGSIANSVVNIPNATLQIRADGTASNGTLTYGNNIQVTASGAMIDVGNNGGGNTGNIAAFGMLAAPTGATANTINFTGSNGYNQSFTGLSLTGLTGQTTTLNPTTTSVTIFGNV